MAKRNGQQEAANGNGNRLELDHLHPEYRNLSQEEHKNRAFAKLDEFIKRGTANAQNVVRRVMEEIPEDRIVRAQSVEYIPAPGGIEVKLGSGTQGVHRHALGQMATRSGIPLTYVDRLAESDWGRELLANNLNELHRHMDGEDRILARSINGQVRGWLSDRYRRLDSRPILDAVLNEVQKAGGQVVDGVGSDTKLSLRVIVPKVVEPVPGDYAVLGFGYSNSDFGNGALTFTSFLLRLICINGAMRESALRQVHLGGKLADSIAFSERTYLLDSETTASASADLVRALLGPAKLDELSTAIRTASEQQIDAKVALANLRTKNRVSQGEAEKLIEVYNTPDVELLPPGNNKWRFSNALSFLAGKTEDADRRMELEKLAGDVLDA